ncbi:hypothetical protein [Halalkalibacter lacteus]|uniref:hypothetical protein n=1 Tax=Halalkalibacter lacteus TaxID=3090663 RepID=UPI002FCA2199
MIKRFTSQEIFIILAAVFVLLFMYITIILSASSSEASDVNDEIDQSIVSVEIESMFEQTSSQYRILALNIGGVGKNNE